MQILVSQSDWGDARLEDINVHCAITVTSA